MGTTSTLLSIAGLAVGAYGVYYLYTNHYIDKILGAIKLPGGSSTTPADSGDSTDKPADTTPPASKCKAGELEDSKGKCIKCGTSLDSKGKCVKASKSSIAQITSNGYVAAYRGWQPHSFRMTVG